MVVFNCLKIIYKVYIKSYVGVFQIKYLKKTLIFKIYSMKCIAFLYLIYLKIDVKMNELSEY